ncbi:5'/3'-nucleotidase SurE [Enhygromyxa salina]|uniref:5'-nucleotidase SurE n=1 Tax=Enhygromyxa salina TaxID=215803 RepID=A0A2S9XW64_9BACT|nr:5'/3'-nucleotidase SurE [Enhygromyxa salina]PRP97117.1 5'/3'-nucleotidase SurE [Enhygromyxa salina]
MGRPLILVSNDDGIRAPGLRVLARVAAEFGDVLVCAPTEERSGFSHAISLHSSLRTNSTPELGDNWYAVSGTPVDCVYLASLHLCERRPDLVLTGVNPGYNLGADVFYSGTVGAAREGLLRGCTAMAVSVEAEADPALSVPFVRQLVPLLLARAALGERHLLNLNVPRKPTGLRVARLGHRSYDDQVDERKDLAGRSYFWIGGPPAPINDDSDSDIGLVSRGFAALTPLELDITAPEIDDWATWVAAKDSSTT